MVDVSARLKKVKEMVDAGAYFTINRARQYGKTTMIRALTEYLSENYTVIPLDFEKILERFLVHYTDLYGDRDDSFHEKEGRKYFLFYLKPIINGTGNYYIEAETRDGKRTDVIVDYHGKQYVTEMKIWHGEEYNHRGEKQFAEYLDAYHLEKGYMLSFNFNKKKTIGIQTLNIHGKTIVEAVV